MKKILDLLKLAKVKGGETSAIGVSYCFEDEIVVNNQILCCEDEILVSNQVLR